jgi:hypothetical protein
VVGDLPAKGVEKRSVEERAGIPGQRGSVVMEGDKAGDATSHSVAPLASARRASSLSLQESGSPGRQL